MITFPAHARPWATTVAMIQAKGAWSWSHSNQTQKNENNPLERANATSERRNCKFIIPPRMWNSWICWGFTNWKATLDLFPRMETSANSAAVIWRQEKPAAVLAPLSSLNICSGKARENCINVLISLNLTQRCSRFRHVSEIHLHPSPWFVFCCCSCFSIKLKSKNEQYVNTSHIYTHIFSVCTETKWKPVFVKCGYPRQYHLGQEAGVVFPPEGKFSCCEGEILFSPQNGERLQSLYITQFSVRSFSPGRASPKSQRVHSWDM